MAQNKPTGVLDKEFFEVLEKYTKIHEMTSDSGFKFYAPKFLEVGVRERMNQVVTELKDIDSKLKLLQNFRYNYDKYELEVSEHNWLYVDHNEMERRQRVYGFLSRNYNYRTRNQTIKELNTKRNVLMEEYRCAFSVLTGDQAKRSQNNVDYLKNLPMADVYYGYLSECLTAFAELFKTHHFVEKYNLKAGFDREKFNVMLKELAALDGSKKKKAEAPQSSDYEQLTLF